jgi:hypothetical protein
VPPIRIDAGHFSPDTRALIALLHAHGVRYLIVGGEAAIFHGHARLTGDVDFFFDAGQENVARLYAALESFWGGEIPGIGSVDELTATGTVVQFGVPPNRIDLINEIDGVGFEEAWEDRVDAIMVADDEPIPLPYIGVDALVKNKRAAGRPKDLDDLSYLTGEG